MNNNSENIHFDSVDSNYVDPFDARFQLFAPLRNVKRIHLKSLELPITFPNIRASGTLNQIVLKTNTSITYTVSIAEGNYNTLSTLLTAINNAFVGVIPSTTVTFAQIGSSNRISCTATTSTFTSFTFIDTSLSKVVLGFRNPTYGSLVVNSKVDFVLNIDNYISMYLSNVNNINNSNRLCSFKVPVSSGNGVIQFTGDQSGFKQSIDLGSEGQVINSLQVKIYDRFNQQILSNNADYSFTLAFEFSTTNNIS